MNGNTKTIQVEERTFLIRKMNAKCSLKLAKTILAKALPAFSMFFEEKKQKQIEIVKENELFLAIQNCLDTLEDKDLDKWMSDYASNNNTYFVDQKKNFLHMKNDFEQYTKKCA